MLSVVEKFYSIQGEGAFTGNPSIFLRLGGCNLKCEGFGCSEPSAKNGEIIKGCDSIYAVNARHFKHTWDYYDDFKDLVNETNKLLPIKNRDVKPDIVITGGEPTLQLKDQVLIDFITYYISRGHRVTFETNATVPIDFDRNDILRRCNFIMSVKLSNSGEPSFKRVKPDVINNILKETEYSCFKFVVDHDIISNELSEIYDILDEVPFYADVYLMPEGAIPEETDVIIKELAEICLTDGFKFSDRLHTRVWGSTKGT